MAIQRENIVITGASGSGKTTEAVRRAKDIPRAIVFQWDGFDPSKNIFGCERHFESGLELIEYLAPYAGNEKPFRVSCYPSVADRKIVVDGATRETSEFREILRAAPEIRKLSLIIDEIDTYFPKGVNVTPPEFDHIARRGRHFEIGMIEISQNPNGIPIVGRREATEVTCFSLALETDLKFLRDFPGAGDAVAAQVATLKRYEYIRVDRAGTWTRGRTSL